MLLSLSVRQTVLAVFALLLSFGTLAIRQQVRNVERSAPVDGVTNMSWASNTGQRAKVLQRHGLSQDGMPEQRMEFICPANDTLAGAFKGHPSSPPPHSHLKQDEYFTVVRGAAGFYLDGTEIVVREGSKEVATPFQRPHTFWNADPSRDLVLQARTVTRVGNSTDFVAVIETIFGLSRDNGGLDKTNPLQLLLTFVEGGDLDLEAPASVNWLIRHVACPLARLLGYKALYAEYSIEP